MRRSEKAITDRKQLDEILHTTDICRLALALDNEPYLVPVAFGYDGECLYFHTATTGRKLAFLEENPRVCFEVERDVRLVTHPGKACAWSFTYKSVIGYGEVRELKSIEDKTHGLDQIMQHYGEGQWSYEESATRVTRVWSLRISSLSGKQSGAIDKSV